MNALRGEFVMACRNGNFDRVFEDLLPRFLRACHEVTTIENHEVYLIDAFKDAFLNDATKDTDDVWRTAVVVVKDFGMTKTKFFTRSGTRSLDIIIRSMSMRRYALLSWLVQALPPHIVNDPYNLEDLQTNIMEILIIARMLCERYNQVKIANQLTTAYAPLIVQYPELYHHTIKELMSLYNDSDVSYKRYTNLRYYRGHHRMFHINDDEMYYNPVSYLKIKKHTQYDQIIAFVEAEHTGCATNPSILVGLTNASFVEYFYDIIDWGFLCDGNEQWKVTMLQHINNKKIEVTQGVIDNYILEPFTWYHTSDTESKITKLNKIFKVMFIELTLTMRRRIRDSDLIAKARSRDQHRIANWLQEFSEE